MPLPAPPVDTIRVALNGTIDTHPFTNVMWLRVGTSGARVVDDLNALLTEFASVYLARFGPHMLDNATWGELKGVWITGPGTELVSTVTVSDAGSGGSSGYVTSDVSLVVDWTINSYYRGGHPRSYIPGVSAAQLVNHSQVLASVQAAVATDALAFKNDLAAFTTGAINSVELGTLRRFSAKVALDPPVFWPYTGAKVRGTVGVQRRRLGG